MRFIWDQKFVMEIRSIDNQHKKFFEIINNLYYLIDNQKVDKESLTKVTAELVKYGEQHMSYEEECFDKFSYEWAKEHKADHDMFRQKIKNDIEEIGKDSADLEKISRRMADFARDWLSEHILAVDRKYIAFFMKHDID